MSAATKKPPSAGVGRVNNEPGSSPSSSPNKPSHRSTASTGNIARSRSLRTGTPGAAARAAGARKESPLSGGNKAADTSEADEAARAETLALMDDLRERLAKAEASSEDYRKQAEVLQSRLDEGLQESTKLEEKNHEQDEQIEALQNEKREVSRQMREMEAIYEAERSSMMKEKEEHSNREEEMQMVIQRLKDSLAQRSSNNEEEARPGRQSANSSPTVEGGFAPPSSLNRSDSRNNSKLLLQKDKLIESLRLELAEAQIKLVESENSGGGRLQEVEKLLMEARMANARLMEDNESYQLLLQERTLNGEFSKNDLSHMTGDGGSGGANQDALNALEGRPSDAGAGGGTSLADELSEATDNDNESEGYRRLEQELKTAKDQNKALTLYINKIIERLLQHQDFEHILDQSSDGKAPPAAVAAAAAASANTNKDLPPPPDAAPSFLQRAKSMAVGGGGQAAAGKPRPRPMSVMPAAPSAHEDPDTAPRIPIGNLTRSSSTARRSRPVSEQFTGAANIINQMYRGHDGPVSPPLGNPRNSQSFFMSGGGNGPSSTPRQVSTASSATQQSQQQQQQHSSAGNFPGMRSETSSTSGDSASVNNMNAAGDASTPPSQASPPRSHSDKQTTFSGGNKPRPLRLVQENEQKPETQNKRASWMGWASGWGQKKEDQQQQQQQQQTAQQPAQTTPTALSSNASDSIPE